jgi:hypothetical protein
MSPSVTYYALVMFASDTHYHNTNFVIVYFLTLVA